MDELTKSIDRISKQGENIGAMEMYTRIIKEIPIDSYEAVKVVGNTYLDELKEQLK